MFCPLRSFRGPFRNSRAKKDEKGTKEGKQLSSAVVLQAAGVPSVLHLVSNRAGALEQKLQADSAHRDLMFFYSYYSYYAMSFLFIFIVFTMFIYLAPVT